MSSENGTLPPPQEPFKPWQVVVTVKNQHMDVHINWEDKTKPIEHIHRALMVAERYLTMQMQAAYSADAVVKGQQQQRIIMPGRG